MQVYLIQAKKISFVETGNNAEYSIWSARNDCAQCSAIKYKRLVSVSYRVWRHSTASTDYRTHRTVYIH